MTGRLPRPHPRSSGLRPLQPPSATQASHSSNVTEYFPAENGAAIVTRTSTSSLYRSGSFAGDPIMKVPAGTTTISGQVGQSLKVSLGLRQPRSLATCMPSHRAGTGLIAAVGLGALAVDGTTGRSDLGRAL